MITLYGFGPAFGLPDPSPFVTKVEVLLKLAKLAYQVDTEGFAKAPKGKLPYVDDDGLKIADSTFIRWHLESKYQVDFDQALSAYEKGVAWSVEKMLEEHFYWALVDARWCDDANFAKGPARFFDRALWLMRPIITVAIRRGVKSALRAQGFGRHTHDELMRLVAKDLESIAAILGNQAYLMGAEPCAADASLFPFLMGTLCPHFDTPMRDLTSNYDNLVAYTERLRQEFFPG